MRTNYVPCLKTTDAELRGYDTLGNEIKDNILPIFELTRSRRSSRNPEGDIHRKVEEIRESVGRREMILDLTTHDDLINDQILDLHDDANAFGAWREFVADTGLNVIPVVHVLEGGDLINLQREAAALEETHGKVAFRMDAFDDNSKSYVEAIAQAIDSTDNFILIIDLNFVGQRGALGAADLVTRRIAEIDPRDKPGTISMLASSFPRAVATGDYGDDEYGWFAAEEVLAHKFLLSRPITENVIYGDYGSIHPRRYETRGGSWVPRIDFPMDEAFMYHRYRRDDGGYVRCAEEMVEDKDYFSATTWADEQIAAAADGSPNGRSPSFWISARVNLHISRQFNRLQALALQQASVA